MLGDSAHLPIVSTQDQTNTQTDTQTHTLRLAGRADLYSIFLALAKGPGQVVPVG